MPTPKRTRSPDELRAARTRAPGRRARAAASGNGNAVTNASGDEAMMRDVLLHFRTVVRAIRRHYQRVEQACGISGAQLWALAQIAQTPGLRVGDLARQLAIHQSTASNMLDKLEAGGFTSRRRDDVDQRVVRLFATPKGRRVLGRAPRPLRGVLQQGLIDLPPASLAALNRELASLVRCMNVRERGAQRILLEGEIGVREP